MQRADGSFGELLDNEERTFDGGLADEPFHEAHAGFTFCGIGALALDERLQECQQNGQSSAINTNGMSPGRRPKVGDVLGDLDKTIRWLVARLTTLLDEDESTMDDEDDETVADIETTPLQTPSHFAAGSDAESFTKLRSYPIDAPSQIAHSTPLMQGQRQEDLDRMTGFNGRSNKVADTCYAFWVCGSLSLLGSLRLTEPMPIRRYLLERTQHVIAGGFGKLPGDPPDIYHSYLALAALALIDGNKDDDPVIGPDIEKGQNEVAAESNSQKETKADDRKERNLRALDPLMCFSVRARKWLENLEWHRVP
ncbi:MAG: hypothetical protein M1828_001479 [Chrysothrix sp. TS-e1954]|nr:MAG: hypothetical protein M1828_001479 [Chrysothrix sp. TS-e1954]